MQENQTQNNLKKMEEEKKNVIQKTMDHPINDAVKGAELKDAIGTNHDQKTSPNQVSIILDKFENRIIKKKKVKLGV